MGSRRCKKYECICTTVIIRYANCVSKIQVTLQLRYDAKYNMLD